MHPTADPTRYAASPAIFDFDTLPDRRGTDSQKWQKYEGRDILPMWVADMDFRSPPAVIEAIRRRAEHGVFGYARPTKSTVQAVTDTLATRYGWDVDPSWLVWLPGLVCGMNVVTLAFTAPGDEVICLAPVYPPFTLSPRNQGRVSVPVPLRLESDAATPGSDALAGLPGSYATAGSSGSGATAGSPGSDATVGSPGLRPTGRWTIDWDSLEAAITPKSKMFILCHPHNPLARIWTQEELARIAAFCVRHNLILCSDEIHCDLILDPAVRHLPMAKVSSAPRLLTLMAPSKTYNLPGMGTSFAIISDPAIRAQFVRATVGIVAEVTTLGYAACEAAYRDSEPWRLALLAYLRGNRDFLLTTLAREIPEIQVEAPIDATYLAWLNVSALKLPHPTAFFETHGVGLSDGVPFSDPPGRHVRINFGCTRSTLEEALRRMKSGVASLR